ncbi:MAG: hypothetical protein AAGJ84_14570 [Pseudomonadota bacterium]
MLRGLPASLFLHAAIVGAGYVAWPYMSATTGDDEPIIVAVDLVTIGEFDNIAAVREREPEPEPEEEPQPEPEPEAPEPEEIQEPEDELVDESLPEDDISTASTAPEPEPEAPQETVPDFQDNPQDALEELLETPEETTPPVQQRDTLDDFLSDAESTFASERQTRKRQDPPPAPRKELVDVPQTTEQRRGAGEQTANSARLESVFYSQIYPCWDNVVDLPNPETLNVSLQVNLDENGNIKDRIRMLEPSREPLGRSPMRVAIERARRAVQKCAPYKLPRQEYETWQSITVNLGPRFGDTGSPQ